MATGPEERMRGVGLPELLAPAGCLDALLAAVAAGADAVYAGLDGFNARATAQNFSAAELAAGAAVAHAHGVRVYVALNVVVSDAEVDRALDVAGEALASGADALIVSDWGLAEALAEAFPGVELHLSTQTNVHAAPGVALAARELGVARVTTSRELSLDEIAGLVAAGVDIEVFCHGAICVCYSGACGLAERLRGRSALKGLCSQPCRQSWRLVGSDGGGASAVGGDKLLCPRDFLSIRHIPELVRAGVAALKIEGRMKNPDYVHGAVRAYRSALDAVARGEDVPAGELEFELGKLFNRSFTDAYLTGRPDSPFMSYERSMNQGVHVGRLERRVARDEYVIDLDRPVGEGDTLEVRSCPDQNAKVVRPKRWSMVEAPAAAPAGGSLQVHIKRRIELGSDVHLVKSAELVERAREAVRSLRRELPEATGALEASARVRSHRALASACGGRARGAECRIACVVGSLGAARRALDATSPALDVCVRQEVVEEDPGAWSALLPHMGVVLGEACRAGELERARSLMRRARLSVCRNLSEVAIARDEGVDFDVAAPLSVCNVRTASFFSRLGARCVWLSPEAELASFAAAAPSGVRLGWTAYEFPQLMITETCLLRAAGPCDGSCAACRRRRERFLLEEADGHRIDVEVDAHGRSRLFDTVPVDGMGRIGEAFAAGMDRVVVDAGRTGEDGALALLESVLAARAAYLGAAGPFEKGGSHA